MSSLHFILQGNIMHKLTQIFVFLEIFLLALPGAIMHSLALPAAGQGHRCAVRGGAATHEAAVGEEVHAVHAQSQATLRGHLAQTPVLIPSIPRCHPVFHCIPWHVMHCNEDDSSAMQYYVAAMYQSLLTRHQKDGGEQSHLRIQNLP